MLCDRCKNNEATIHRKVIVNGVGYETHLCSMCAGLDETSPIDIFNDFVNETLAWDEDEDDWVTSFNQLDNTPTFKELSDDEVVDAPKNKDYKLDDSPLTISSQIANLENQLKLAVEVENYEEASKIKEKIEKLKNNGNSSDKK